MESDKVEAMLPQLTPLPRPRLRWTVVLLSSFIFYLSSAPLALAATITVSPGESISNAIDAASHGDTIYLTGEHNLAQKNIAVDKFIHFVGQDAVLLNGSLIHLYQAATFDNITFKDWRKNYGDSVFIPAGNIDGLVVENCTFENVPAVMHWFYSEHNFSNIYIRDNVIKNVNSPYNTFVVTLVNGSIDGIYITGNTIENVYSTASNRSVIPLQFGNNTHNINNILVQDNKIHTLRGGTTAVRGVLAYGSNIQVRNNDIRDIDYSPSYPRNCIYLKSTNSIIDGNTLTNCGNGLWGSGSLSIKGQDGVSNTISHNTISSLHPDDGIGIYTNVTANIIENTVNGEEVGIFSYGDTGYHADLTINSNTVISNNIALWVWGDASGTGCGNNLNGEKRISTSDFILSTTCPSPSTPSPSSKPGDLNGDGQVNLADYNLLVAGYGTKYTLSDYNQLVANYGK